MNQSFFKAIKNKANTISALHFKTKYGKAIVSSIMVLESLLEEIAEPKIEITRDNIVSTKLREFLGYKSPLDIPEPVRDTTAKSKWQEILNGADKLSKDKEFRKEHSQKSFNRVVEEIRDAQQTNIAKEEAVDLLAKYNGQQKKALAEAKAFDEDFLAW